MLIFQRRLPVVLLLALACLTAGCGDSASSGSTRVAFVPNSFAFWDNPQHWPTSYGPAYADILLGGDNFVPCEGGPIALCYYSGPEPQTCTLTAGGRFANCDCVEIPYGPYFVLINSILNYAVYLDTVGVCGADGSGCVGRANKAPVCGVINKGELIPGADVISTFSYACVPESGLGQTVCTPAPYAGCMTAPCNHTDTPGIVTCQCPIFDGPFQVGNFGAECSLPAPLTWSAAYSPTVGMVTAPNPPSCVPDAPGDIGCPLLGPSTMLPPGTDCAAVCNEYSSCLNHVGVEVGFTCDATLCTAGCAEQDLVDIACAGLSSCQLPAIIALEQAAECSCCASQLCGCGSNDATDAELVRLNQLQESRGVQTQCELNGTLCGQ